MRTMTEEGKLRAAKKINYSTILTKRIQQMDGLSLTSGCVTHLILAFICWRTLFSFDDNSFIQYLISIFLPFTTNRKANKSKTNKLGVSVKQDESVHEM